MTQYYILQTELSAPINFHYSNQKFAYFFETLNYNKYSF